MFNKIKTDHCDLCGIPVYLYPSESKFLCKNCYEKEAYFIQKPCESCGRVIEYQFHCGVCDRWACNGCIYSDEHSWDCVGWDENEY